MLDPTNVQIFAWLASSFSKARAVNLEGKGPKIKLDQAKLGFEKHRKMPLKSVEFVVHDLSILEPDSCKHD